MEGIGVTLKFRIARRSVSLSNMVAIPVLVLFFLALWFILRGDLLYVFPCVILFFVFFSPFCDYLAW